MMAGTAVALLLGAMSAVTLGMVTAGDSVPGDWNYAFKLAGERIEYSLSSGNNRVDVRLNQTFARIQELQKLNERGDVSPQVIEELRHNLEEIDSLAKRRPLDPLQQANTRAIAQAASAVLDDVLQDQPELAEQIEPTIATAAAIADGAVTTVEEPTPTPTDEPTATPEPSPTQLPDPTPTAAAAESPSPDATEQPLEVEPAPAPGIDGPAE
jgi:TolA-binding protein